MHRKWQLYVWKGTRVLQERSLAYFSFYFGKKLTTTLNFLLFNIAPVLPVCHGNEIFFIINQRKLVVSGKCFDINPLGVNVALVYKDTCFYHAYFGFLIVLILVMIISKISKQYIFRVPSMTRSCLNSTSDKKSNRWMIQY